MEKGTGTLPHVGMISWWSAVRFDPQEVARLRVTISKAL